MFNWSNSSFGIDISLTIKHFRKHFSPQNLKNSQIRCEKKYRVLPNTSTPLSTLKRKNPAPMWNKNRKNISWFADNNLRAAKFSRARKRKSKVWDGWRKRLRSRQVGTKRSDKAEKSSHAKLFNTVKLWQGERKIEGKEKHNFG